MRSRSRGGTEGASAAAGNRRGWRHLFARRVRRGQKPAFDLGAGVSGRARRTARPVDEGESASGWSSFPPINNPEGDRRRRRGIRWRNCPGHALPSIPAPPERSCPCAAGTEFKILGVRRRHVVGVPRSGWWSGSRTHALADLRDHFARDTRERPALVYNHDASRPFEALDDRVDVERPDGPHVEHVADDALLLQLVRGFDAEVHRTPERHERAVAATRRTTCRAGGRPRRRDREPPSGTMPCRRACSTRG